MQLFKYFKELTIHPKNAEELKGLILQLAIQGKLTQKWREQNPDVEPASVLLEKIKAEKELLIKEKKIKREKPLPKIDEAEVSFKVVSNWSVTRLGDLGNTQTGSTPPKKNPNYYGDFFSFLGPADISNNWMRYPDQGLSELGLSNGRLIPKNSLMMVCIGGSIGKCNINEIDVSCNQQINTITPILISVEFIRIVCQSSYFQKEVFEKSTGSATPIINKGKWESIPLPIPPLEEQKAIVCIVNQLFKEVDELEAKTKERFQLKEDFVTSALKRLADASSINGEWAFLQQHFKSFFNTKEAVKKLRETILQLAVQGKLTHHWRLSHPLGGDAEGRGGIESASVLLEKIKAEKEQLIKNKKIKKEKPLPEIAEDEIPYELPEGWVWCRFGDLISFLNGYAFKSSTYIENSKYQVIRLGNVKNDNFLIDIKEAFIPKEIATGALDYQLQENDILTTLTGTKGKRDYCFTCLVRKEHLKDKILLLNQRVGCIRAIDKSSSEIINKFLKADVILEQLFSTESGTANQGNIGSTAFKNVAYPLPPLEEQKAIVSKVNSLMALCDELEQEIVQNTKQVEDLMQSCLREVINPNMEKELH